MKKLLLKFLIGISIIGIIIGVFYTFNILHPQPNLEETYRLRCTLYQEDCNVKIENLKVVNESFLEGLIYGLYNSSHWGSIFISNKMNIPEDAKEILYSRGEYTYNYTARFLGNFIWILTFIMILVFVRRRVSIA